MNGGDQAPSAAAPTEEDVRLALAVVQLTYIIIGLQVWLLVLTALVVRMLYFRFWLLCKRPGAADPASSPPAPPLSDAQIQIHSQEPPKITINIPKADSPALGSGAASAWTNIPIAAHRT